VSQASIHPVLVIVMMCGSGRSTASLLSFPICSLITLIYLVEKEKNLQESQDASPASIHPGLDDGNGGGRSSSSSF
jgi:hypothetical protein